MTQKSLGEPKSEIIGELDIMVSMIWSSRIFITVDLKRNEGREIGESTCNFRESCLRRE